MSPVPSHTEPKPLAVEPGLVTKALTFVAAPANDSAFRRRRFGLSTLSVPSAAMRDEPEAGAPSPAASLASMPLALAGAWASAQMTLCDRYLTDTLGSPLRLVTGWSLMRLVVDSTAVNAAVSAACIESLADLGGAALDRSTAPFRR